jgi:MFS family permease
MDYDKKIVGVEKNVFLSGLVSFFMDFSAKMIYPLVPIFLSSVLGVNKSVIGLIEGIAESMTSLLKIFSGWFSDKIQKRKALLIAGYGISALSRPVIALSTAWSHVFIFRLIDRFGKGIRVSPRDALIAECTDCKEFGRAFGLHRAFDTFGSAVGPAIAFLILFFLTENYRLIFWLSMIPGVISVLIIIFFIKDKKIDPQIDQPKVSFKNFGWRFKAFVAATTLFAVGNSSDVFLILKASDVGIQTAMIPLVYLLFNLIYSLTSLPAGILSDRIGRRKIILVGFILFGFIYWGFALASKQSHIWMLFAAYGIFMGLTEGIQKAYLGTIMPEESRATGYGIYNAFTGLALLPASIVGGFLWDKYGPQATFYYGMITAFISAAVFLIIFGLDKIITARKNSEG